MLRRHLRVDLEASPNGAKALRLALALPESIEIDTSLGDVVLEIGSDQAGKVRVDGRRLPAGRRCLLGGERMTHRGRHVILKARNASEPLDSGTRTLARAALASPLGATAPAAPCLVVLEGECAGRRWPLAKGRQTIGRGARAEIVLADPTVSRLHAEVRRHEEHVVIRDLGSRHGVRLGRRRLKRERIIPRGMDIALGNVRLRLLDKATEKNASPPSRGSSTPAGNGSPSRRKRHAERWMAAFAVGLVLFGGALLTIAAG